MFKSGLAFFTVLLLTGCASNSARLPEVSVAERAQAHADALIESNYKEAYRFTTPAYRSSFPLSRYKVNYQGSSSWSFANVNSVVCESTLCKVVLDVRYKSVYAGSEIATQLSQKWVLVDGAWWLYIK